MKGLKFAAMGVVLLIVGGWLILRSATILIPIGVVGVRIQQYGIIGQKGVVQKDFTPGWHRDLGPIDNWELYDSTVQTLEMTRETGYGSEMGMDDVKVQSADGYRISVDVTVKYRIMSGMAHKLYQDTGRGTKYKPVVRNEAQKACIGLLGLMKTEDFYNPMERRKKSIEIRDALRESLADNFIDVIDVLVRDIKFDPEYEKKIRRKKLADQEVELNKSMAKAEAMRGKTQVIEAETGKLTRIIAIEKESQIVTMQAQAKREVVKIRADAEKYATERQADADLIAARNQAKGQLLVSKAEAEGERLRNAAMEGVGGSTIVALEAAKNLNLTDITISTMVIDLLDIDGMATRLGVPKR